MHYHGETTHRALQCLAQLASLNGPVFSDEEAQLKYLSNFTDRFVKALKTYESLSLSRSLFHLLVLLFDRVLIFQPNSPLW